MRLRNLFALTATALFLLAWPFTGEAQLPGHGVVKPDAQEAQSITAPVFFMTLGDETLAAARKALDEGRRGAWDGAVRKIQSLVAEFGDAMVPVDGDEGRFADFAHYMFGEIISDKNALKAYRFRFDTEAARLIDEARRSGADEPLLKILRNFLPSSHADDALMLLAERFRESGANLLADSCLKEIGELGAPSDLPSELIIARRASCLAALRDVPALEALSTALTPEVAGKTIRFLKNDVTVADFISALLKEARAAGGGPLIWKDRPYRLGAESAVSLDKTIFTTELPFAPKQPQAAQGGWLRAQTRTADFIGFADVVPFYALYVDGRICVSGEYSLTVFDAAGNLQWKIGEENGAPWTAITRPTVLYYPTAWRGNIFYLAPPPPAPSLPQQDGGGRDPALIAGAAPSGPRSLFCADLKTGKALWNTEGAEADPALRGVNFCTPPAFIDERAYAVGITVEKEMRSYTLYCIQARTGKLLWKSSLCDVDVTSDNMGITSNIPPSQGRALLPSPDGLRLYIIADEGATMCVSALDGRKEWLVRYEIQQILRNNPFLAVVALPYWLEFGPILACDKLIAPVGDCRYLNVHEPRTGKTLWRWNNKEILCRSVLGIRGDEIFLGGNGVVKISLKSGKLLADPLRPPEIGFGRACIGDRFLYWPQKGGVVAYDLNDFSVASVFSLDTMAQVKDVGAITKERHEYSGNLSIAAGRLISVSMSRITVIGGAAAQP